jgi:hypothetical protein
LASEVRDLANAFSVETTVYSVPGVVPTPGWNWRTPSAFFGVSDLVCSWAVPLFVAQLALFMAQLPFIRGGKCRYSWRNSRCFCG